MSNLLRPLSWLFAAIGLLNLAKDLSYVEISQKLAAWSDAYQLFVSTVASVGFGWLKIFSLSISTPEMHVLIVATILATATARAGYIESRNMNEPQENGPIFYFLATLFFPGMILLLFDNLAATFSALGVTILLGLGIVVTGGFDPDSKIVRTELVGVFATFICLVVLNYALRSR
jgi:hypothetical protein